MPVLSLWTHADAGSKGSLGLVSSLSYLGILPTINDRLQCLWYHFDGSDSFWSLRLCGDQFWRPVAPPSSPSMSLHIYTAVALHSVYTATVYQWWAALSWIRNKGLMFILHVVVGERGHHKHLMTYSVRFSADMILGSSWNTHTVVHFLLKQTPTIS